MKLEHGSLQTITTIVSLRYKTECEETKKAGSWRSGNPQIHTMLIVCVPFITWNLPCLKDVVE